MSWKIALIIAVAFIGIVAASMDLDAEVSDSDPKSITVEWTVGQKVGTSVAPGCNSWSGDDVPGIAFTIDNNGSIPRLHAAGTPTTTGTYHLTTNNGYTITINVVAASSVHSITFKTNGGVGTETTWTVQDGNQVQLPTKLFSKSGYVLTGWSKLSNGNNPYSAGSTVTITQDMTLYAVWTQIEGTLDDNQTSYVGANWSYLPVRNSNYDEDWMLLYAIYAERYPLSELTLISAPLWMSLNSSIGEISLTGSPSTPGNHIITVGVKFQGSVAETVSFVLNVPSSGDRTYTVSYSNNNGTGTIASKTGYDGTAITLPSSGLMKKTGYVQAGWDINVNGTEATFPLNSYYTISGKNVTAKAHWIAEANVVILDGSGQIGKDVQAFVGYNMECTALPSEGYSKDGYKFLGWYDSTHPDQYYAPGYMYMINGPVYMSAYYAPNSATLRTITYDANGGTGSLEQQVQNGGSIILPVKGFSSKTNLIGWTDGKTEYKPGDAVTVSSNTTFKAVWGKDAPDVCTVSFDLNGGQGSISSQSVSYGALATKPPTPVKTASIFQSWFIVGGGEMNWGAPVTQNLELKAIWADHFTRTYSGNTVQVIMANNYAYMNTTIDWGDGNHSNGTVAFSHSYDNAFVGYITVTSEVQGTFVSSQAYVDVTGDENLVPVPDSDNSWIWKVAIVLIVIVGVVWYGHRELWF